MKILLISDAVSPALYDHFDDRTCADISMVISCGDLPLDYLEFIISMLNVPCYCVPGNHDEQFVGMPPPGWKILDDRIVVHDSIKILGLGGSMRYKPGPYQYSELGMKLRFLKLVPKLWLHKNKIDILVTHAPAYKLGDLEGPHRGFKVFRSIIENYKPKYHLHGHVHLNYCQNVRTIKHDQTEIINGYEYYKFEY